MNYKILKFVNFLQLLIDTKNREKKIADFYII